MNSIYQPVPGVKPEVPLFLERVKAGFPSPAESYTEKSLNLHDLAVENPAATFFLVESGDSMVGAGVFPGDYLVVDRSLPPRRNDLVVAEINGEMTFKRLDFDHGLPILCPENPGYPVIRPRPGDVFAVWGVVRGVFRKLK